MIVFGEKPEYFGSVWVKNEWSRFKARIEKGEKHKNSLVVVYKNMYPNELPAVLRARQCLNAADMTFLSDLTRHIKRVVQEDEKNIKIEKIEIKGGQISKKSTTLSVNTVQTKEIGRGATAQTSITEKQSIGLMKTYHEEEIWKEVIELADDILFNNPTCGEAILYRLLAEHQAKDTIALIKKLSFNTIEELGAIEKVLNCATKEMAENILQELYLSYGYAKNINYIKLFEFILPYDFSDRKECISTVFTRVISQEDYELFKLLLNTLDNDDVDEYISYNLEFARNCNELSKVKKCLENILEVDEGNVEVLRFQIQLNLRNNLYREQNASGKNEESDVLTFEKDVENILKYTESIRKEVVRCINLLIDNIDCYEDKGYFKQILRYYPGQLIEIKKTILRIANNVLEKGRYNEAKYFYELVLSLDETEAEAYWGLCLSKIEVSRETDIKTSSIALSDVPEFNKYLTLVGADRRKHCIAIVKQQEELLTKVKEEETRRKNRLYNDAMRKMAEGSISALTTALSMFRNLDGWIDSEKKITECEHAIKELKEKNAKEESERAEAQRQAEERRKLAKKKRRKKIYITLFLLIAILLGIGIFFLYTKVIAPENKYKEATELMSSGRYEEAADALEEIIDYKDSAEKIEECKIAIKVNKYEVAIGYMQNKQYEEAANVFLEIKEYEDSESQYKEARYQLALIYLADKNFEKSDEIFEEIKDYKDSKDKIHVHDYTVEMLTAPACETAGEEKYICKECSYSYVAEIDKTGHSYDSETVTKKATCTEKGEKKFVCSTCKNAITEEIPMIDHSYTSKVTTVATCEKDGVKTFTCKCGKNYTETIKATGHKYDSGKVTTAATCEKDGVKTFSCSCGKSYTETVAKTGHAYSEATCVEDSACSKCGDVRQKAFGHDKDYTYRCTRCNADLSEPLSVIIDELDNKHYSIVGFSNLNYEQHGSGKFKVTVTVLETNTNDVTAEDTPYVKFKDGMEMYNCIENAQPGDVVEHEIYLGGYGGIRYIIQWCKVKIEIEPLD